MLKQRKSTMCHIVGLFCLAQILCASADVNGVLQPFKPAIQMGGDLTVDKMRAQNLNVVRKAVEGISKTLPQRVDSHTQMTAIDSNGTELIYRFEVEAGEKSDEVLRKEGEKRMAPVVKRGICRSAKRFLQSDITITYSYLNKATGHEILHVTVRKTDCDDVSSNE
jgi:hypothetical protein